MRTDVWPEGVCSNVLYCALNSSFALPTVVENEIQSPDRVTEEALMPCDASHEWTASVVSWVGLLNSWTCR